MKKIGIIIDMQDMGDVWYIIARDDAGGLEVYVPHPPMSIMTRRNIGKELWQDNTGRCEVHVPTEPGRVADGTSRPMTPLLDAPEGGA